MKETNYVATLRDIRDRIGQAVQDSSWEDWERRIGEEVAREPGLARMLGRAIKPSPRNRLTREKP